MGGVTILPDRHPSESWDLTAFAAVEKRREIPAFAGMTLRD